MSQCQYTSRLRRSEGARIAAVTLDKKDKILLGTRAHCAYCQAAEKCSRGYAFFALGCCTLQTNGAHMKHAGLDIQENEIDRIVYRTAGQSLWAADENSGTVDGAGATARALLRPSGRRTDKTRRNLL